jgi:hypothetical protein
MDVALSPPANGPVVPDKDHSGMWRSVKVDGILSEAANLCWSKNNVIAQAIREVAWDGANDPQKCPVKRGSREQKSSPMRFRCRRPPAARPHAGLPDQYVARSLDVPRSRHCDTPTHFTIVQHC